jgi:hypothetical protein
VRVLDRTIRERIAPIMKAAGFKRKGRLFWLESAMGDRAFLWFSPFKLGEHDAEFFVDAGIVPAAYADFVTRDGDSAVMTGTALWSLRLTVPGKQGYVGRDLWSFDAGDEEATEKLTATIRDVVPGLVQLLDPAHLLEHVRDPSTRPQEIRLPRQNAITLLLSEHGSADELEGLLVALEEPGVDPSGDLAEFIRHRVAHRSEPSTEPNG